MLSQIEKFNRRVQKTAQIQQKRHNAQQNATNQVHNINQDLTKLSYEELFALMRRTKPEDKEMGALIAHALNQKMIEDGKLKASLSQDEIREELSNKYKLWLAQQEQQAQIPNKEALVPATTQTMSISLYQKPINEGVVAYTQSMPPVEDVEYEEISGNKTSSKEENKDWIKAKHAFWERFALENNKSPAYDIQENSFSCTLKDQEGKTSFGTISYDSPNDAQISKDADLLMYKGLVKDAAANNLSITFGDSLEIKQQALLMAAILIHGNENDKKIEMINEPQLDLNAPYFKELPKEAQDALIKHAFIKERTQNMPQRKSRLSSPHLLPEKININPLLLPAHNGRNESR